MSWQGPPTVSTRMAEEVMVVELEGRWPTASSGDVSDRFAEIVQRGNHHVLVNLARLEFLSSAGMRVLLRSAKTLREQGGELKICGATGLVVEVLNVSGFDQLLDLRDTEAAALAAFRRGGT